MIREAIDAIPAPDGPERIARAVAWLFGFAVLHAGTRFIARRGLLVNSRRVERDLRRDVFAHVIRLPLSFFGRTPTGDIMSRLANDVSAVWLFLGPGLLTLGGTAVSYVLALGFMIRISPLLTLAALALAPLVVLVSREYGRSFHRRHRLAQESLSLMNAVLQENITGIRLVKAYGLEESEGERFARACRDYYDRNVAISRTSAAFHGAIGFLAGTGIAVVLLLGGWAVIRGGLTLGGFVAFNAYLAMLSFPTMALGWVINLFQRAGSAMGRINEFLALSPEEGTAGQGDTGRAGAGDPGGAKENPLIEVRDLSFSYGGPGRPEALRGVSFSVARGETIGLVGKTGSGKSTLLSLLNGLFPAPPGTVFLEGRDVRTMALRDIRRRIAWVGQEPFLFSDTILANLCIGLPAEDEAAARRAAARARLLDEIEEMPDRMGTVVGERGISLSGGQKQRATIARALCAGGDLLVLDDALSSVDAEAERGIFASLLSDRGDGAILFSTHRLATLSRCDRIVVLSEGRVAEEGTHDDLLARRGDYFDLYARQMLVRELTEEA